VFPAPVRAVLRTTTYDEARATSLAASGRSLSLQTFGLVPAIRSLDDALGEPPDTRVVEVHPELSFRTLDERVTDRKSSASGLAQRIRALEQVMDVLDALAQAPAALPVVDALDACAAAWSAQRIAAGTAQCVGDGSTDSRGRPMRICF
jgi:predicted RNase H-like nuclease